MRERWPPPRGWVRLAVSIGLASVLAFVYLRGLAAAPFHPDESSQIFMSRDFEALFLRRDPAALAWRPDQPLAPDMSLRLLDAPVTRYLIGLGWWLSGFTVDELNADWVWGATWEENQAALPSPELLGAARAPIILLSVLSTVVLFWWGLRLEGWATGLFAALFTGLDPLMLLHARRAMAESALTFFSALAALGSLLLAITCDRLDRLNWRAALAGVLVGVLSGLALCSKQTEVVMLPVAWLAGGLAIIQRPWPLRQRLTTLAALGLAVGVGSGLTFWLLNPVLSRHPVGAFQEMLRLRAELARSQVEVNGARDPAIVLRSVPSRLSAMFLQLYFYGAPEVWDAPVYLEQLQPAAQAYLAGPLHRWLNRPLWPELGLGLTGLALGVCAYRVVRDRFGRQTRAEQTLLLWFGLTLILLALVIPLNWQRYFLPLLLPARLLTAFGAALALKWAWSRFARSERVPRNLPR